MRVLTDALVSFRIRGGHRTTRFGRLEGEKSKVKMAEMIIMTFSSLAQSINDCSAAAEHL